MTCSSTWQSINLSSPNPNPQIKQHTSMALFSYALQQAFMPKHEYDNLREQDKALIQLQRPVLISLLLCIVIVIVTSLVTPMVEVWWMGRYICFLGLSGAAIKLFTMTGNQLIGVATYHLVTYCSIVSLKIFIILISK